MKDAFMNKSRLYPNPNPNDTTPYSAKKKTRFSTEGN